MPKDRHTAIETEEALEQNAPFYLIELALDGTTLRFTSHDTDVTFPLSGGSQYTAWGFRFTGIDGRLGMEVDRMRVEFDNVSTDFSQWADQYVFQGRKLTVMRVFTGQLDDADKATVLFAGEMGAPEIGEEKCAIEIRSPLIRLNQRLQKRRYSPECPWKFDGDECRPGSASSIADETAGTADTGSDASTLVDDARTEVDDYWTPGTLEMTGGTAANIGGKRQVKSSTSGEIQMRQEFPAAIQAGDTYTVRRRCYKTALDCQARFDNLVNYGGFEMIPRRKV